MCASLFLIPRLTSPLTIVPQYKELDSTNEQLQKQLESLNIQYEQLQKDYQEVVEKKTEAEVKLFNAHGALRRTEKELAKAKEILEEQRPRIEALQQIGSITKSLVSEEDFDSFYGKSWLMD